MIIESKIEVAASPALVWRALTDGRELRLWAGDMAHIDLERGGQLAVQGGVAPLGGLQAVIEAIDPRERLIFRWAEREQPCRVEWIVSPIPQGGWSNAIYSEVTVRLGPDVEDTDWTWRTVWSLWLRALRAWCERGETRIRVNGTDDDPGVEERITIRASVQQIWPYLSDPERVKSWFHEPLGREIERVEERWIRYQWPEDDSHVTWRVVATGEGTCDVIVQHPLKTSLAFPYRVGWKDYLVELSYRGGRPRIVQTIHVNAPPDRVWPYLSTRKGMESWWSSITAFRPGLGGYVEMAEHGAIEFGDIVEWEPNRRMAFLWREKGEALMATAPLKVTVLLVAEEEGTRVLLYDEGFEHLPESIFRGYQLGWAVGEELERLANVWA